MLNSRDDYFGQLETRRQQIIVWAAAEKAKVDEGTLKEQRILEAVFQKGY